MFVKRNDLQHGFERHKPQEAYSVFTVMLLADSSLYSGSRILFRIFPISREELICGVKDGYFQNTGPP